MKIKKKTYKRGFLNKGFFIQKNAGSFHLYHYAGNNPVKYTDPDGRFLTRQFLAGLSQLTSGILEEVGAAGISAGTVGVGTGVGVFLGLDGIYNISDGFAKALSA